MSAEDAALSAVMDLLEVEPSSGAEGGVVPAVSASEPDILALREQLVVLVSTGKAKEAIGVQLTYEQVKRLSDKHVEKYTKRYETYVGSKTTESLIDSFIFAFNQSGWAGRQHQRHRGLSKGPQKRLHHKQRALHSCWQPCFEMWPVSGGGQRVADHHKTS